jgi:glycosyltransferase involved in cell wall biosynthesis
MSENFVSIIIPAYNSIRTMKKCVESLLALNYPEGAYEAIIIDDGSTDGTPVVLEKYKDNPKIRIISVPNGGPSKARNMAIKEARGEFIAFTDADCIVDREWLNCLMQSFAADGSVIGVGGDQLSPSDEAEFGTQLNGFLKLIGFISDYVKGDAGAGHTAIRETEHNPTCNVMYKKEVFQKAGFFTEDLWPGEDVELDHKIRKLGYRLLFNPAAVVFHYRPADIKGFLKMMFRYGRVQAILVKRYGFFRKIQYVPFLVIFSILLYIFTFTLNHAAFLLLLLLQLSVFVFYFMEHTKKPLLSVKYTWLLTLTVAAWNSGFAAGVFSKK